MNANWKGLQSPSDQRYFKELRMLNLMKITLLFPNLYQTSKNARFIIYMINYVKQTTLHILVIELGQLQY